MDEVTPEMLAVGDTYKGAGNDHFTAGIHVGEHANRIECYGRTEPEAEALRDRVFAALQRTQPSGDDVEREARRIVAQAATELGYCDDDIEVYRSGQLDGDDLLPVQAVELALAAMDREPIAVGDHSDRLARRMGAEFVAREPAEQSAADRVKALEEALENMRAQGQAEGKAAVVQWLRDKLAMKPTPMFAEQAAMLADMFEQSEIPCQALEGR